MLVHKTIHLLTQSRSHPPIYPLPRMHPQAMLSSFVPFFIILLYLLFITIAIGVNVKVLKNICDVTYHKLVPI